MKEKKVTVKEAPLKKVLVGEPVFEKLRELLAQALTHRRRLEGAVKLLAIRNGTCWCGVTTVHLIRGRESILHTVACDQLYLALYGSERGK